MTVENALAIIAAYGADARRWPVAERAGVEALVATDAQVAAAVAEAAMLDDVITGWARDVAPAHFDAARLMPARSGVGRWFAGGAVAAGLALALVLGGRGADPAATAAGTDVVVASAATEGEASSDAESFALLFTPTSDEEDVI